MKMYILAYVSALVPFLLIDGVWLSVMAKRLYMPQLGALMSPTPQWAAAGIFYLIYLVGLVVLVVVPSLENGWSAGHTFFIGALLGLVAYGTYDLTNQATLQGWPVFITIVDLCWGALLTGSVALIAHLMVQALTT